MNTLPTRRVAIVLSDGLSVKGGIGRVMTYLKREIDAHVPDIALSVHAARLTDRPVIKHMSVPLALAAFAVRCFIQRIEIAHINVAPRGSTWRKRLFARTAKAMGCHVVLHLHGSGYDAFYASQSQGKQDRIRAFFASADKVVALSPYWSRFLIAEMGIDGGKIVEIPNGVPNATSERIEDSNPIPSIVFLGLVGQRKGTDVLIDALGLLAQRGQAFRAVIAGNGEVDTAIAQAKALHIADHVDFPGWVGEAEADALLNAADIFVLPSRAENQPVSILEAMARAVPVVATRVGAIPEQVDDGESGLLVDPGDAAQLADAVERLIASAELRRNLGAAGQRRFARDFSVAACAQRFAAVYRAL
ncbi:MAG: glycosyltransferase family 4 protein [Pseudomonadota bacterium]